jgi:hypothetical protein
MYPTAPDPPRPLVVLTEEEILEDLTYPYGVRATLSRSRDAAVPAEQLPQAA